MVEVFQCCVEEAECKQNKQFACRRKEFFLSRDFQRYRAIFDFIFMTS